MNPGTLRIIISLTLILSAMSVMGQPRPQEPRQGPDRETVLAELRPYQHEFLAKELKLTKEQSRAFFSLYDSMDDVLQQVGEETRDLERQTLDNASASDIELEAAAQAVFSQKEREGKIEMEYYQKFKEILTPRQLLGLKDAERKFTQKLMRQHRRMSRDRSNPPSGRR